MKEVDMQRIMNHSNMKEEHVHCRLHTIIPVAIDMQCVEYAPTAIEAYMHRM